MEPAGSFAAFIAVVEAMTGKLIPDELVVLTAGAEAAQSAMHIGQSFAAAYAAVALVLTACYLLGALVGGVLRSNFHPGRGSGHTPFRIPFAGWMLCLGVFFPVARHLLPFWAGVHRFDLRRCLLYVLPSSFLWTAHYFFAGYWLSDKVDLLQAAIYPYSKISLTGLLCIAVLYVLVRQLRRTGGWLPSEEGAAGNEKRSEYE
ncbi:DedA family protein [Brevibacillus sp. GCM10020057]|uniref:DedA family protein n=1 Tax=Brevibacillus sp. GCM10020057 TaxID=3317327 RepID=UPI0036402185